MKWPIVEIETLKASGRNALVGGPFGSDLTSKSYVEEGVPVIRGNNLPDHTAFHDQDFVFVSDEKAASLSSNTAGPRDLIFTQRGTLGQIGLIPDTPNFPRYVISQSQMKLTVDETKAEPRFIYYYFRLPTTVEAIKSHVSSSGVPHINLGVLRRFKIPLPPLQQQRRIVEVAAAYDDLMENNRRRMALLEESARLLYREWFVHLRFPGHEKTKLTNGMPKGWERVPAPEAIEVNPRIKLPDEDQHWYVEMADLPTDSMVIQSAIKREGRSGSKFQNGDTLFARITPCLENGKTGYVNFMAEGEAGRGSTEFIVLRSKRVTPEFVYCMARTYEFRENAIRSMIGASGRQRAQESCFAKFQVWCPPQSIMKAFSEFTEPAFEQIKNLHLQTQKLRTARDLLLPRLMSGEIVV